MRILGIDYGDTRIGLSVSDETLTIATPIKTYFSVSMRKDIDYVAALIKEKNVSKTVLGLPINMDGTKGERANKTEAFGRNLQKVSGVEVVYKDERMTTLEAQRSLAFGGLSKEKQQKNIDSVAAQIILQSYR